MWTAATYPWVHEGHPRKLGDRNIADVEHHVSLAACFALELRDAVCGQAQFWRTVFVALSGWRVKSAPVSLPSSSRSRFPPCGHFAPAPTVRRMTGTRKDIVVVDLGGSTIKVGFAGDADPSRCASPAASLPPDRWSKSRCPN